MSTTALARQAHWALLLVVLGTLLVGHTLLGQSWFLTLLRAAPPVVDVRAEAPSFEGARRGPGGELVLSGRENDVAVASALYTPEAGSDYWLRLETGPGPGARILPVEEDARLELLVPPSPEPLVTNDLFRTGSVGVVTRLRILHHGPGELEIRQLELVPLDGTYGILRLAIPTLASLALLSFLARHPRDRRGWALALFLVTALLYFQVDGPAGANRSDSQWYVPTSLSLLHDGDIELSEYLPYRDFGRHRYRRMEIDGRHYNAYPIGTSLVTLPLVWLADLRDDVTSQRIARALWISRWVAVLLAAGSVALLFLVAVELTDPLTALGLTVLFAFCTPQFSTHAGGLWSHNVSSFLVLAALYLLLVEDGRRAGLAGLPLTFAFLTRPTSAIPIAALSLFVARQRSRRQLILFVASAAIVAVAFALWSYATFGTLLPPYYRQGDRFGVAQLFAALAGHLVSPSRGLFVFSPILLFAVYGVVVAWRRTTPAIYRYLSATVIAHWVLVSFWKVWWGGGSYGPRLMSEVVPLVVLLMIPACSRLRDKTLVQRAPWLASALLLAAFSFWVHYRGATRPEVKEWNIRPDSKRWPAHVWNWSDPQFLR